MKNATINSETMIRVYVDSIISPSRITYAADVNGDPKFLAEYGADMNDWTDIEEMAVSGPHFCGNEHFPEYYFLVRNGDFPEPF